MIAFDTNVLADLAGVDRAPDDARKIGLTREFVPMLASWIRLGAPTPAIAELFHLFRRNGESKAVARERTELATAGMRRLPTTITVFEASLDLATRHRFQIWDAIVLATAAEGSARWLLCDDMHAGRVWGSATIVNPYTRDPAVLLARLA